MEGFSLTCSSCKAKLRVRDRSLVGQIVDCPKCGGSILVKPAGDVRPGREDEITVTDSMAIPDEPADRSAPPAILGGAFDEIDALLSASAEPPPPMPRGAGAHHPPATTPQPQAKPATRPQNPKPAIQAKDSKSSQSKGPSSSGGVPAPPLNPAPATIAAMTANIPHAPAAEAPEPPVSPKRNPYALLALSLTGGVVLTLVVALLASYLLRPAKSEKVVASATTPEATASQNTTPTKQTPVTEQNPKATESPTAPAETEEPTKEPPPAEMEAGPEAPSETITKPEEKEPAKEDAADPLGIAGGNDPVKKPPVKPTTNKTPGVPGVPTNALSDFSKLLDDGSTTDDAPPAEGPEAVASDPPSVEPPAETVTPAKVGEEEAVGPQPILPRPAPRKVDVAARLADPLAGLELEGVPLADVLRVISDLTTIPITLEPDLLPYVKVSPDTKVTSKHTNATVGAALTEILKSQNLTAITIEDQIVIRPADAADSAKLTSRTIAWSDLTGGDQQVAIALSDTISHLVDPDSWQVGEESTGPTFHTLAAGKDSLMLNTHFENFARVFTLCEKLRVARHLPLKSKFPPELFDLRPRSEAASVKLSQKVKLNFSQPTSFTKIMARLEEAGKLRILIDWRSLAEASWNPDGEAQLVVEDIPLRDALKKLLDPMELAFRVVDARTLQIVSRQTLSQRLELELYSAKDLVKNPEDGPGIVARAEAAFPEGVLTSTGGKGSIAWEAKSMSILASLTQPDQEQLASLLKQWAQPKPDGE
ncbi:MAG: hypothetical protein U0894_19655 [Pirellulales bacterium]